ncbi:phosphopentomutase/phosphoglucosamine mutase [Methanofollis aquaemaris]|uniref:Phosphopentomutase/phosphoglucosamine mutase n=1 Tax=Methanofollis aquaemaris TaxID=126734 RepID=A0A8A3S6H0_9EURY|nr:phosphopentomutase/phosphoglucosamine mutase [Methanofollis aquaemaris]QSZ67270.1 phosphopentomutase/phosphoglucosamine mutase [Methanofollis aquaemaris]
MLFGSSGIRRRYSGAFPGLAAKVGVAVGKNGLSAAVGRDTRVTGQLIADAVTSGILSAGADVYDCGIAPTPTIACAARGHALGVMVTASHNPEEYNGIKLLNPDGSSFTSVQQQETEEALQADHLTGWEEQGRVRPLDAVSIHIKAILDQVNVPEELNAVVDCGNGAGSVITPRLLADGGVHVLALNANPEGRFVRPSEPLEEHLPYMPAMIRKQNAACGIIHDGDADRMMAFDGSGRYIGGDHLMMLFAEYLGAKQVVTTADASMAIEEIAEVRRTPVGDTYVSEELLKWGDFGGEASGAWIFPKNSLCPDGIYAGALLCEIAGEWNLAETVAAMPSYPILRDSVRLDDAREVMTAMGAAVPTDGIRIEEEDGWCLVRASGTEPKVRFTAEGRDLAAAKRMMETGKERLRTAHQGRDI